MKAIARQGLIWAFMAILALPAVVQAQFSYTIQNSQITITGYTGSGGDVAIPGTINGLPVTAIGASAFLGCSFTNVSIPASVTSIGTEAFANCAKLTTITVNASNPVYCSAGGVLFDKNQTILFAYPGGNTGSYTIPGTVTIIGPWSFGYSSLTSVTIPASVTSIQDSAFDTCTKLISMTIPSSVTNIGNFAFYWCTSLTSVTIPNSVTSIGAWAFSACTSLPNIIIPNGVTYIREGTFCNCYVLTAITIPNSVTTIGDFAFFCCGNLATLTIPASVATLQDYAFCNCSGLTAVFFNGNAPAMGSNVFAGDSAILYYQPATTGWTPTLGGLQTAQVANPLFLYVDNGDGTCTITGYTGPDADIAIPKKINGLTVTAIGAYAFVNSIIFYNNSPTNVNVTIPNTVTNIGDCAFFDCNLVNTMTIPSSVTSIGAWAFSGTFLSGVTIPASVTNLGLGAFTQNTSLTAITVATSNACYSSSADGILFDKRQSTLLTYPGGGTGSYVISNSVSSIGTWAFINCSLSCVTIPASVTNIGEAAFTYCNLLTNITVAAANTYYRSSADGVLFDANQTMLLTYPGGKTGSYTIPSSVTSIGPWAFSYSGLTSVTIPSGVTNLGAYAFYYCSAMQSITFKGQAPSLSSEALTLPSPLVGPYWFCYDPATIYYSSGTTGWDSTFDGLPVIPVRAPSAQAKAILGGAVPSVRSVPIMLWNPQILPDTTFGIQASKKFGFTITNLGNPTVVVEASTNLSSSVWLPVSTNTLTGGSFHFIDAESSAYPTRFYRLRQP